MADSQRDAPPPFDEPFTGEDTQQRVYAAILHAREPMTAAEIAERADCPEDAARKHLSFYADLSIALQHEGRPVRYERHDDYFEWRRASRLAQDHTIGELREREAELTDQIQQYRDKYDTDSPANVNILEFDAEEIDDRYIELGNWATLIEDLKLHKRAQQTL